MRSMVIGAFALPITNTIFAWLATQGPDFHSLLVAIGVDKAGESSNPSSASNATPTLVDGIFGFVVTPLAPIGSTGCG